MRVTRLVDAESTRCDVGPAPKSVAMLHFTAATSRFRLGRERANSVRSDGGWGVLQPVSATFN
ncbi:hypothetical protein DSK43_21960, partial [Mycobacterium tuberculosis]